MPRYHVDDEHPGSSLVPVVWFEAIDRWKKKYDVPMTSLFFHKLTTLTRFRLEAEGYPIPLPYSWFLFGPTAADLPHAVDIHSEASREEASPDTAVAWRGPRPELYPGDRGADLIRKTLDALLEEYPPDQGERAVDEAYLHAPYEFQKRYRRLRIACGLTGRGSAETQAISPTGGVWTLVQDAFEEFPYDQFATLAPSVAIVRETVNVGLNARLDQRKHLATEAIEEFWSAFAYSLRADSEGHRNVSPTTVQYWRRAAERRFRRFVRNLGDIVVDLSDWEPSIRKDATLGPFADKREAEQDQEKRLIEEGFDALWGTSSTAEPGAEG